MRPTHIIPRNLFQKESMGTNMLKVGPRADRWIEEVIQRLHEEHPYMAQYTLQGKLVNSDNEKQYGLGYIEVRTPSESKQKSPASRIPFVVENGLLHPLKVFIDDEGVHDLLDKDIFAEAMFSAPTSLALSDKGDDPSLVGTLYPPDRTRHGFGGSLSSGAEKQSHLKLSLGEDVTPGDIAALLGMAGAGIGGASGAATGAIRAPKGERLKGALRGGALGAATGGASSALIPGGLYGAPVAGIASGEYMAHRLKKKKEASIHRPQDGPYLGDEAEALLKESGVELSKQERRALHKKAMARLDEAPGSVSVLDKIAHTIDKEDQRRFAETVLREDLGGHFKTNGFLGLAQMAVTLERPKTAAAPIRDVVQVMRLGQGRYQIKKANVDGFKPSTDVVSAQDASALVGEDLVPQLDQDGRVTMTTQPATQKTLEDIRVEPIDDYGVYKVQELESNKHVIGWCITNVIDFYMNSSPLKLFNGGKQYALQEDIAGVRVSMGTALPKKEPESGDTGVFYYTNNAGRVTCTLPVTITHLENNGGEEFLGAIDLWGKPMKFSYAPDLKVIVDMGEKGFAIPDSMSWMPLYEEVRLVPDAMLFSKLAQIDHMDSMLEIIGRQAAYADGQPSFSFRGKPVEKIAQEDKHFLSDDAAEFVLVSAGVPVERAREKLAEAAVYGHTSLIGARELVSPEIRQEKIAAIAKRIRSMCDVSDLKKDTVKIAAGLPSAASPQSVDSILSLNFINSDNLMLFIENLPHLEQARKDLAEIYLGTTLGLPDISSTSVIRAAEALRDVSNGLRKLRMRAMLV